LDTSKCDIHSVPEQLTSKTRPPHWRHLTKSARTTGEASNVSSSSSNVDTFTKMKQVADEISQLHLDIRKKPYTCSPEKSITGHTFEFEMIN
jgi:hypothetical protein